ncbi:DUF4332 domain-containing protein [uncultured Gimesia sp.]|jgi:uncharacterized protein YhaN|uniref:DUF4332 domain-containing protein n=1 Tax=uncultured Gimesia sp. TaxID=1678688 RepID=UPI00260D9206|nr:DUF4332 domain-containing protein [uncultured Gimesia sp.]
MKITRIHVDQFGNWNDLNLAPLNAGINVFYGPNETGKSTLMRMIRGLLYGFQPEEIREHSRVSDLTPWSALLDIQHKGQHYEIRRQTSAQGRGNFSFQGESRGISSQDLLTSLHAGVNESVYENVFAIGLNELQELGTLHGDQVAQHIYGLSLGPEGQAILDASGRLNQSRQKLLSRDCKTGKLAELYQQLDRVNLELAGLEQQAQRFFNLSSELQNLRAESDSLKKRKAGLQYQIRGHRFLDRAWRPWQEVQTLRQKLKQLPTIHSFPEEGIALLNDYEQELNQVEGKLLQVKAEIKRLRKEIEQYESDNDLLNFAPNILSLADQKSWIVDLEQQNQQGESRVKAAEQALSQHLEQHQTLKQFSQIKTTPDNNQRLINAARAYRLAFGKRKNAHQRYKKVSRKYQQTLAQLQEQSSRLLEKHSIDEELQRARQRMKHLERLSQLRVRESEVLIRQQAVKEQLARLQSHARIPGWAKKMLFSFALAGMLLMIAGFWRGVSDAILIGLIFSLAGMFLGGTAWALKKHYETDVDDQAEELQDESWALDVHLRETRQEIERLLEDEYFSLKIVTEGHSLSSHKHRDPIPALNYNDENILRTDLLHELALKIGELEQLKAAQERAQKTRQLLVKLRNRSQEIQRLFSGKRHEWCECLKQLGLTETLKTDEAFQMWHQVSNANLYANQLEQEKRRIKPLGEIVNMFYSRVRDLGLRMDRSQHNFEKPFDVIAEWERELDSLSVRQRERTRLRKEEKKLRLESDALQLKTQELKHNLSSLLIEGGAANREEFIQRAASLEEQIRIEDLLHDAQTELEKISRSEQEIAIVEEDLLNFNPDENTEHLGMLNLELEDIEGDLVTTAENMGRLKQDYQNARTDRSAAHLRFEREQILEQIRQAGTMWFADELSAVGLNQLRSEYERTCQPETLAIASDYLRQLTNGKYRNIWTPLGEQFPKIDDQQGHTLTVSELSSGTREQLFLAIRLAMVERFRNHGVELPMILDDVLVNFDQDRTIAAIQTLRAVAEKGQQILFFTCHLHLTRLFEEQGGPPVWLPDTNSPQAIPSDFSPQQTHNLKPTSDAEIVTDPSTTVSEEPASSVPDYSLEWPSPIQSLNTLNDSQIQALNQAGIHTIDDLLERDADQIAWELQQDHLSAGSIFEWQSQARLASCIRGITAAQAALLVSCGITETNEVATMPLEELWSLVESSQQLTGDHADPVITKHRVQQWIHWAQQARIHHSDRGDSAQQSEMSQSESALEKREYRRDDPHHSPDNFNPTIPPFYLNRSMPVEAAPSIGLKTAHRLENIGIFTINDFLECNPAFVSGKLRVHHINEQTIRQWKLQTKLACCIPGLRGHDAQILVACGFSEPDAIASTSPNELFEKVKAFVKTNEGQRIIRNGNQPDLREITDWINWSQQARELRAA